MLHRKQLVTGTPNEDKDVVIKRSAGIHMLLCPLCGTMTWNLTSVTYRQFQSDLRNKIRVFSTLSMCSDHILSNKLWLYCPISIIKDCLPILGNRPMTHGTLSCEKLSRRPWSFFSKLVNATKKGFCMVVNNPLSWGLSNITKVYSITCGQSTCSKLKKHEFCPVL